MNWEETLASYESNGQTIKAFCLDHGIKQATFKYHLYRKRRKREDAGGFVKLNNPVSVALLEICYPNGVRILVHGELKGEEIKKLIHV
jgi:hypothetical protein